MEGGFKLSGSGSFGLCFKASLTSVYGGLFIADLG